MRLLTHDLNGNLVLQTFDDDSSLPPYAILSHTWHEDDTQEVSFEDLKMGQAMGKPGYGKIRFCEQQGAVDRLQYFWIDTCCIDKSDKAEESQAIRSMFRWYRKAARCYVYLSDVSTSTPEHSTVDESWEAEFRKSKWFTRGWTLQELLAPSTVEFFSQEQRRLGDKTSLKIHIHKATGIPYEALQGVPLSYFTIDERLRWRQHRYTKHPEDGAYSLQGIFGVDLAPIYSEGAVEAFKRLRQAIDHVDKCVSDIRSTDPRDDKKRIEATKGGLLEDSYRWVLTNANFQQWLSDTQSSLLWIKGDPGKGKTMLMCGIIEELQKTKSYTATVAYFFFQANDSRINSAVAALRGLLYLLVSQQPSLASHVRKKYDRAGKPVFEDANAWIALTEVLADVLKDPGLDLTYLVIDALDECITDMPKLLAFLTKQSAASSKVKWLVSSRNWPDIEERLEQAGHKARLSLELNAQSVSTAVQIFIEHKVFQLARQKKYDEQTRQATLDYLQLRANDTFLWVALVCQELEGTSKRHVRKKLESFPPGLDSLYARMIQQISSSDDADVCKQILGVNALVYRPITLEELAALSTELQDISANSEITKELVSLCGSFLTLRDRTIYFVHQSAQDFLFAKAANKMFPSGKEDTHHTIFVKSLKSMSKNLRRDIYGLKAIGCPIEEAPRPDPDPLATSRYSCIYWVDHLRDSSPTISASYREDLRNGGIVNQFLESKFLYWLEALSLCKSMPKGVVSIATLQALVQHIEGASGLIKLIYDAYRFVMYHHRAIETSPLQVYTSSLLFSPVKSLVRRLFKHKEPDWITILPATSDGWSACLQTLEGHRSDVRSVAFSHDSTRLASASDDTTVKIWDASSGACLQTLEGHSDVVRSVAFSHDSTRLASASWDNMVKIWDASSGACLQTLEGHSDVVRSVAFSHDSTRLASASFDSTVKIWDASSGACLQTLEGHNYSVWSVAFSHDSTRLASASFDSTVKIWDASSGACLQTLEGHSDNVNSMAFSDDSTRLASASDDSTVKIWDASSGECLETLVVNQTLSNLSFDSSGSLLHTDIGNIAISTSTGFNLVSQIEPQEPKFSEIGVGLDMIWITYNGNNVLWIPSEYRGKYSAVCENKVSIGTGSGRVWICIINI